VVAPSDTGRTVADPFRVTRRPDSTAGAAGATTPRAADARPAAPGDAAPVVTSEDLAALRARGLRVPVQGVSAARVPDTFNERRDGGSRPHQALDIAAPRGTPVVAAGDGRVHRFFKSDAGGLTVYVLDSSGRFIHYYAHLDAYHPGLAEGQTVRAGDPIGTVGSTGNANPAAPHLHFAVARIDDPSRWWSGTPIDPRPFLR
jgi:murein DD-endopeptidase MepM/ murein hydrolase activator NlpD